MRQRPRPRLGAAVLAVLLATATAGSISAESASINAAVRVMPLAISLELSTSEAKVGDAVRARATITNLGPTRVSKVSIEVRVNASGVRVKEPLVASIGQLQPGKSGSVSWSLCAVGPGGYLVLARATLGGASVESEARLLTIAGQSKRACR